MRKSETAYRMVADRYYKSTARDYDKKRDYKPCWAREQAAVESFVHVGPVLDVPCGTGRYVQLYKDKGLVAQGVDASDEMIALAQQKHPDFVAQRGTVLDLPFPDKAFQTVVCSRLLNWLYPVDMAKAAQELRRAGREIVASIRIGDKGHHKGQGNYTHSLEDWYAAIDGLMIEDYRWVLTAPDGEFGMYRLRKPRWRDVEAAFKWHKDGTGAIQRLTDNWTDCYGLRRVTARAGRLRAERWTHERLKQLVIKMARTPRIDGVENKMMTDELPKYEDGYIIVVRTQGHEAIIDGRRRANRWMDTRGFCKVLVIHAT